MSRVYNVTVFTAPKLIFVIGDFENREELRRGLVYPLERDQAPLDERRKWIDATLEAYQPFFNHPVQQVDSRFAFAYRAPREHKVILVTHALQERLRESLPFFDRGMELPLSKFGGDIIGYNLNLLRESKDYFDSLGYAGYDPKLLSVVVSEESLGSELEAAVATEFDAGADVFMVGRRSAAEYLDLIRAWFGGNVNPRKYKDSFFNPERFKESKDLLVPTHNYEPKQ